MAEENVDNLVETPLDTAYYSQDASIDKLQIITVTGQAIDVKKLLIEFSYYEDIFNFVVSGYIILRDAIGLIEKLQLTGKEFIEISFGKARGLNTVNNDFVFRLYAIPKRTPSGNLNAEYIKLHFCSEELLLSEQIKVTKSYSGKPIYSNVYDVLVDKLKVNPKRVIVEQTEGNYDFNVNTLRPFEAISWMSCYARPSINNTVGADMLMYETRDGFNFRSISSLLKQPIYKTYTYQPKNLENSDFGNQLKTVLEYEFIKTFNSLDDINSGTFANRLISLDPLNRTVKVTNFDYEKYLNQTGGKTSALATAPNRLGLTQNQAYTGTLKLGVTNSEQKLRPYVQQGVGSLANDIYFEKFVPNRTAQLSLATYTKVKLKIPGDSAITVGKTIDFNLMTLMQTDETEKGFDRYYSGKYLVTAVRHIIQSQGAFQTILEIAKEKPDNAYSSVSPNNINYKQALFE